MEPNVQLEVAFESAQGFSLSLGKERVSGLKFESPFTPSDAEIFRRYLEIYSAHEYGTEIDDTEARETESRFVELGKKLYSRLIPHRAAESILDRWLSQSERLLTIVSDNPIVHQIPWELLHLPGPHGGFLVSGHPRTEIRRQILQPLVQGFSSRKRLRILFVVSRCEAQFIDHRSDPEAILDVLEQIGGGQVDVEFLRPATRQALTKRLSDAERPVDILHFDGHGGFEPVDNSGELILEDPDRPWAAKPIGADGFAEIVASAQVPIVILSACRSAANPGAEDDRAMGSTAAALLKAGIQSVLAMSHSVMVVTTRLFFESFYQALFAGKSIGQAVASARGRLQRETERRMVWRGINRIPLRLQDWFVPVLYQCASDSSPLVGMVELTRNPSLSSTTERPTAAFSGRSRELWRIERRFLGGARLVAITGFAGIGKTTLVSEAANWLRRSGFFERVVAVSFANYSGSDALDYAIAVIANEIGWHFSTPNEVAGWLRHTPTLVLLDDLDRISAADRQVIWNAAIEWSRAGNSRVLLTERRSSIESPETGNHEIAIESLDELGELDAFSYASHLVHESEIPLQNRPNAEELRSLLKVTGGLPLSIEASISLLRRRAVADVIQDLDNALVTNPDADRLTAAFRNIVNTLPEKDRRLLPLLTEFHPSGASKSMILRILLLAYGKYPDVIPAGLVGEDIPIWRSISSIRWENLQDVKHAEEEFLERNWSSIGGGLLAALVDACAIREEISPVSDDVYFRFHPAFLSFVKEEVGGLEPETSSNLLQRHCESYFFLSQVLFQLDQREPDAARWLGRRELPNLIRAVDTAFSSRAEYKIEFARNVAQQLQFFGRGKEEGLLLKRAVESAREPGFSQLWLAHFHWACHLQINGKLDDAISQFELTLKHANSDVPFQRFQTLNRLASCHFRRSEPQMALQYYDEALKLARRLPSDTRHRREINGARIGRADTLRNLGRHDEAKRELDGVAPDEESLGLSRDQAVLAVSLGTLALDQGKSKAARDYYSTAIDIFERLDDADGLASTIYQRAISLEQEKDWEEAEKDYRKSAEIEMRRGNIAGAADSWNAMALMMKNFDLAPFKIVRKWYEEALKVFEDLKDTARLAQQCNNLADLLCSEGGGLDRAQELAERAKDLRESLDPNATQIWTTYTILARIAEAKNEPDRERHFRLRALTAWSNFPGAIQDLKAGGHDSLVECAIFAAHGDQGMKTLTTALLSQYSGSGNRWQRLVPAVERILQGVRDESLYDGLAYRQAHMVQLILEGITDPESIMKKFE